MKTKLAEIEEIGQSPLEQDRKKECKDHPDRLFNSIGGCEIVFSHGDKKQFKSEAHALDFYHKKHGCQNSFFVVARNGDIVKVMRDEL